jgi:hypothetical protein
MRLASDENALLIFGDLINNTGTSQQIDVVSGIFYDGQGQAIANDRNMQGNWPIDVVPPGGQVPFEVTVHGIEIAASFNLNVEAAPLRDAPRHDFEFLNLSQTGEEGNYCINGQVRNSGGRLENYLVIVAVLYDGEDKVIGYGEYAAPSPGEVADDAMLAFEICIDTLGLSVARYDVQAWGE